MRTVSYDMLPYENITTYQQQQVRLLPLNDSFYQRGFSLASMIFLLHISNRQDVFLLETLYQNFLRRSTVTA